jgi:uncharacterized RDD family membrane protein YckC
MTLPIFMLILLILGLFGLLNPDQEPQINISQFLCVILFVFYLFQAICGLNHLDLSGYNKI